MGRPPYVLASMNLLLLLSAMLSALSGAGIGTRAASVPVAVNAVSTVAAAAEVADAVVAGRPAQVVPSRGTVARGPALARWSLAPTEPLYSSRRRE